MLTSDCDNSIPRKTALKHPMAGPLLRGLLFASLALFTACDGSSPEEANAAVETNQAIPVATETARLGSVRSTIGITGTLSAMQEVTITAEGAGRVVALDTVLGQRVEQGQPLAHLDDIVERAQRAQAEAQLMQAEANLGLARADFARNDKLREQGAVSELQHEQTRVREETASAAATAARAGLQLAQQSLSNTVVRAPFDGTVASVQLELGALVAPGTPAFQLVAIEQIKVDGGVPAREVGLLQSGQAVRVVVPTLGGAIYDGVLAHVGPAPDPRTRTYPIEVHVDNAEGRLRPGMVARLDVIVGQRDDAILVPETAVIEGDQPIVFVVEGDIATKRAVTLGRSDEGHVEIREGVANGDTVVTLGRQHLSDGSRIQRYELPATDSAEPRP
ncbi:MAG TPA: hypothetical protein DIU15_18580 [Deltaproteobacteria bacterium]|nr:hypothetical protein [Deltaproteobacteria bacterium]HCP48052.1 hypothetical protein [Deltaproteobacteria bacterium]